MRDRRIDALQVVLERGRRRDAALSKTLARKRVEEGELRAEEQCKLGAWDAQRAELQTHVLRLKDMASRGGRIVPREYERSVQWRDVLRERCAQCEAEWRRECAALEQKAAEIAATMGEMRINQARIDAYEARIESLRQAASRHEQEAQEEEAEESRRPRAVSFAS